VLPEILCIWAVRACYRASWTLLTHYLEKCWTYFHQTFSIGAFWDKGERFRFWGEWVKVKVMVGPTCWKMHFLALLAQYLENNWSEFHETFSIDTFWTRRNIFWGQKVTESRSQITVWPRAQRAEAYRAWRCVILISSVKIVCSYVKLCWLLHTAACLE